MNIDSQPITDFKIGDRNFMVSFYERRFDRLRKTGSELPLQYLHRLFANLQNGKCRGCSEKLKNEVFLCKSAPEARKIGGTFWSIISNSPLVFRRIGNKGGITYTNTTDCFA